MQEAPCCDLCCIRRVETFTGGAWAPVCSEEFAAGSAGVACKQMGFAGAVAPVEAKSCSSFEGHNYCADVAPRISALTCSGTEASIMQCPFIEGDDVFCAPEEAVVLVCSGDGDAQGRAPKPSAPLAELAPYSPKVEFTCDSTLSSEALAATPPGYTVVGSCAQTCSGKVFGSFIFAPGSSICAAAQHAGLIGQGGGDVVVTVGYGQDFYFGFATWIQISMHVHTLASSAVCRGSS